MFKTLTAALPIALALAFAGAASASPICDRLNSELTALSETYSAPANVRTYARAIAEQKMNIRGLRSQLRDTGCSEGSLFVMGGDNAEECHELEAKMARMETNLAILEEKRISLMTGETEDARRQEMLAAIDENGCSEETILANASPDVSAEDPLVSEMPDGRETIRVPSTEGSYEDQQFVDLGGSAVNGSYRTMCVRTCDGAYFPISSQASTMGFQRDAQVCSMMCPGTETELYYHSIREESDAMRSAFTGRSYDELDNAYRFRTQTRAKDKTCGCNFSLYYKEMMKREAFINNPETAPEKKQSSIVWIKPELRGQLKADAAAEAPVKEAKLRDYKPDGHIRQIGPKFLPDNETLDVRNPSMQN
ncbi:MAG: hypothetical protein JWL86_57 [Rhizobium sp.]|nr:hypothetical protein [Rhizobium sp.]